MTFVEPRQQRELEAIEQHIGTTISPWSPGAKVAPAKVEERPKRHEKPHIKRPADEPYTQLIVSVGRDAGLEPADIVHAITHAAGVDGEAVKDVKVLGKFSLLSVPQSEAERVIEQVSGEQVNGTALKLEQVKA